MYQPQYTPDRQTLEKYFLIEFPFSIPPATNTACANPEEYITENLLENEADTFRHQLFQEIQAVFNRQEFTFDLPAGWLSNFYWIVTEYLEQSGSLSEAFQRIAMTNWEDSKEKNKNLKVIDQANKNKKFALRVKSGRASAEITDPNIVAMVQKNVEKDRGRISPNIEKEKPKIALDGRVTACKVLDGYLRHECQIQTKTHRYLIIGTLFSLAGQPFNARTHGRTRPVLHTDRDFWINVDRLIDTVSTYAEKRQKKV